MSVLSISSFNSTVIGGKPSIPDVAIGALAAGLTLGFCELNPPELNVNGTRSLAALLL